MCLPPALRLPVAVVLGLAACGVTSGTREIGAQEGATTTAPDSAELRERARDAQRRFERIRVRHLPRIWSSPRGPCEIRIGRFCQWHDPDGDWTPPPERPEIGQAREDLLAVLAEAGARHPGDGWVLGQRIQYLSEAGRWDDARNLAEDCPEEVGWWCAALLGFVLHGSMSFVAAEDAFERALRGVDDDEIADWIHPTELLDRQGRGLLENATRGGRETFFHRFWALADPLYLVAGNDRLTEHLARRVLAHIRRDTWSPFGGRVRGDLQELLVRYGWEVGWERRRARPGSLPDAPSVVGQQHPRAQRFVPSGSLLADPFAAEAGTWIDEGRAPPATYAPAYAPDLAELDAQIAVFRLGDSILVVGAYRRSPDEEQIGSADGDEEGVFLFAPPEPGDRINSESGLFLVPWAPPGPPRVREARRVGNGAEGALALRAPAESHLLSLEHLDRDSGRAGRYRVGLREEAHPPGIPVLSDLLLLRDGGTLPETLEGAIPLARPGTRLEHGERIRVAFTIHGLRRPEEVTMRLTLEPADPGLLRRAGEWIGLLEPDPSVVLDWGELAEAGPGLHFRAVELDAPDAEPGSYVLRLVVALRGRTTMVATRLLEVTR